MPRLDLIIGVVVPLILCCSGTILSDKVNCAKPPKIENAILLGNWDEVTYPQGHTANYSCQPGYVLARRIKMVCLQEKWIKLSDGQCKKKPCGHPGDTLFGKFELRNANEFVFGAVVEYTCDEGYQMVSKHKTRTCAADGWTNQLPHCEVRLCPPVKDESVKVLTTVNDDEFSMGHVITLECKNPQHRLEGPSKIHCTANGTWNMDPPTCKGFLDQQHQDAKKRLSDEHVISVNQPCGRPPSTPHGEIRTPIRDSYHSGSTVKYKCPLMFETLGHKTIKCRGGVWDQPPFCLEPCTTSDKTMSENNVTLMWNHSNKKLCTRNDQKKKHAKKCYVKHDKTIRFACLPGYIISDPKDLIRKCIRGILQYPKCFKEREQTNDHLDYNIS